MFVFGTEHTYLRESWVRWFLIEVGVVWHKNSGTTAALMCGSSSRLCYDGKQSDMHICICTFFCMQSFQQIFYSLRVTDPQTFKNNRKQNPTYFDVCKVLTPTPETQSLCSNLLLFCCCLLLWIFFCLLSNIQKKYIKYLLHFQLPKPRKLNILKFNKIIKACQFICYVEAQESSGEVPAHHWSKNI